jgi:hypothetical protein
MFHPLEVAFVSAKDVETYRQKKAGVPYNNVEITGQLLLVLL